MTKGGGEYKRKTDCGYPAAITFAGVDGCVQTVYFASCVALFKEADGGRRLLLGEDGSTIEIAPAEWEDGIELAALVDLAIPDQRIMR